MTDVAEIARSLTKAQVREIMRGSISDAPLSLVRTLIRKGVMHIAVESPDGRYGPCVNTPLGLAVRAHLTQEQPR